MLTITWPTIIAVACVIVLDVGRRYIVNRKSLSFPPGPPGIPWVGNVIGIDMNAPWLTYTEWSKKYGGLVYTRLLGKHVIIINSEVVAKDLLESRSRNYSDRPYLITSELSGLGFNSGSLPYGDRWRLHRRFFHQTFRVEAVPRFQLLVHAKGCQLLRRLLGTGTPDQLEEHVFEYSASVILNSVYDYDPKSRKSELIDVAARVLEIVVPALRPDVAIIVGAFPSLLKLPSWFPGLGFKGRLAIARECAQEYLEKPFDWSKKKLVNGSSSPSMMNDALEKLEHDSELGDATWMEGLKEAAATGFLAASETSSSMIMTFLLMMIVAPEVQKKAQAQIDAVVGKGRLPSIEDRPMLPYIDAIIREAFRYQPVAPLSLPHANVDDDIYKGFYIPKGSIILPNVWAMSRDETKYPNANQFIPERFLNEDGSLKPSDIEHIAFGFGRRICVGRHFADASLWSVCSKVLAVYNILRPKDENGIEMNVEEKFTNGASVRPLPFECRIEPRIRGLDTVGLEQLISASAL